METTKESKMIRFIDSHYNLLFRVPDGGNIVLIDSDGLKRVRACKYIDDYHFQPDRNSALHICEFAEIMERNGTRYLPEAPTVLPEKCFSILPSSGEIIIIKRGEKGYFPCSYGSDSPGHNLRTVNHLNEQMGVTPQQRAAMDAGSMFGWTVPAADPNRYDLHGIPLPQSDRDPADSYAIYQLKDTPETRDFLFVPLLRLPKHALSVSGDRYECVYSDKLYPRAFSTDQTLLGNLFHRFNMDHPDDFTGHSLSVSDVVVIERNHVQRAYYVDTIGFTELPDFCAPENSLQTVEMSMEQNLNSIDGQINNLPQAAKDEQNEKKASIQEKIRAPKPEKAIKAPTHTNLTERER